MKKIIVQIYEVQTPHEAETLIELGVDHIGSVILSQESWKNADIRETIKLVGQTDSRASLIPLFSVPDAVFRVLDYYQPHIVHFCEDLSDQRLVKTLMQLHENVRKKFPEIRIMRSIPIARPGGFDRLTPPRIPTLELARIFEPVSDYFLTDTVLEEQPVTGFVGITGQTCDWDTAKKLIESNHIPVILAGGLSPDNVSDAVKYVGPTGVDSCTGTNASDKEGHSIRFKKDTEKVRRFVEAVRILEL